MPMPAAMANSQLSRPPTVQQVILPKPTERGRLRKIQCAAATGSLGTFRFWAITLPVPKGMIPNGTAEPASPWITSKIVPSPPQTTMAS